MKHPALTLNPPHGASTRKPSGRLQPSRKKDWAALLLKSVTVLAALCAFSIMAGMALYILARGLPYLRASMFSWSYTTDNLSMTPAIVNTLLAVLYTLTLSLPAGVGAAIYLQEYARPNSRFVRLVTITAETLSGIPSIVFGLFGMLFFVYTLNMGLSLLAGVLTLSILVLPLIMRTSQEALAAVPDSMREASYALGAGKLQTVFKILLVEAAPGIFTGILLAIGRILGESAALIYTSGAIAKAAFNLMDPGATLSVHMYKLLNEGLYMDQAGAVAVVLFGMALLINLLQSILCKKITKGER